MKPIRCWSTSALIAAALILAASRPLAAADLPAPAGDVDTPDLSDTDLRDFRVSLLGLFNSGRYADLDTLAQQLQQERSRFKGGAWRLHVLLAHSARRVRRQQPMPPGRRTLPSSNSGRS